MLIKGLQKLTLIDYPNNTAATIFIFGCNFKCPYCHNPELVDPKVARDVITCKEKDILKFLKERKDFLDGVCITGGEPVLCRDIESFLKKIKKLGYKIKIDTNGTNPKILKKLIEKKLVDYVAMDIKAPLEKYNDITKSKVNTKNIRDSINIIKKMNDYEFRTTVTQDLKKEDIKKISELINGAKAYYLQQFKPSKCLDISYNKKKPYTLEELKEMWGEIKDYFEICKIRTESY